MSSKSKVIGERFTPRNAFGEFAPVPMVIMSNKELYPIDKLCLALIYKYAGMHGVCYASMSTLAKSLCITRRYAIQIIKKLEGKSFIQVNSRVGTTSEIYPIWHADFNQDVNQSSHPPVNQSTHPQGNRSSHPSEAQFTSGVNQSSHKKNILKENEKDKTGFQPTPIEEIRKRFPDLPGFRQKYSEGRNQEIKRPEGKDYEEKVNKDEEERRELLKSQYEHIIAQER